MRLPKFSSGKGFSLIEMLIVLTVLGILFALAAPNLFTLMQASTLSSEGNLVRNKLTQAQQLALSKNTDVEVRFFKMADPSAAELEEEFRGFQFFLFNEEGDLLPASKFFRIKPPVVISENFSTLLNPGSNSDSEGKEYGFLSPSEGTAEIPVGDTLEPVDYVSFRFRPDGSTDLPGRTSKDDTWYLSLLQGTNTSDGLPANHYIVQVDSYNGKIGVFRP
ncbi:MAG: Verru_Chthon cassette protein D [Verrucomicrobiae bacterium]|nr:Verru_Chthon cassette protein D [Verrucomicrobiae bacterium]